MVISERNFDFSSFITIAFTGQQALEHKILDHHVIYSVPQVAWICVHLFRLNKRRTTYLVVNRSNRANLELSRSIHVPQPAGMAGADNNMLIHSHTNLFSHSNKRQDLFSLRHEQSAYYVFTAGHFICRVVDQAIGRSVIKTLVK